MDSGMAVIALQIYHIYVKSLRFLMIFHNKAWQDAENYCKTFGAHLTSIHSVQENIFIYEFSTAGITVAAGAWTDEVWIGFNDLTNVGDYSWSDGSTVDYINWSPVAPASPSTQQCVCILADEMSTVPERFQKWDTLPCSLVLRAFVCKKPANLLK
uniref:C-type lectin domain-containing protein n=1 Tax=Acrobeloides nanus TaxID=290746 RepID=A0A914ELV0_9BILA